MLTGCKMEDMMWKWYDHEGYFRTVNISKRIVTAFILTYVEAVKLMTATVRNCTFIPFLCLIKHRFLLCICYTNSVTWRDVFLTVHHSTDFSSYQLNAQFLYSITIYMLQHNPQHVSSSTLLIFRRKNCIITASGIVTLCKRPYSMPVESGLSPL